MKVSMNMNKVQKTSKEDYSGEVRLETGDSQRVHSGSMVTYNPKAKSKQYTGNLLEIILHKRNLHEAYKRVKKNNGSHGVDGMKVEELLPYLKLNVDKLIEEILNGTYKPQPVRRVEIPKDNGKKRLLGIPTVIDRLIQQAIAQVLNKVVDENFSEYSYGFRPNRSAHMALKQSLKFINNGYRYIVDLDLERFFDTVQHDKLMGLLAKRIEDKRVLKLIRAYLNSGIMINGVEVISDEGTPQGGPLSPLLSNILLDELDKELQKRNHKFCRYADDCNIFVKSERAGKRVLKSITQFLEKRLKLIVNQGKSTVAPACKIKFLGYSYYYSKGKAQLRVHQCSFEKFKNKIRIATNRNVSMNFQYRLKKLAETTTGWINYYKLANMEKRLKEIEEWTRRRLRACIWKTWKKIKTRFKNLMKLGVKRQKAWEFANTRKGYWRIANSPVLKKTITNQRLINHGFKSLLQQYMDIRLS